MENVKEEIQRRFNKSWIETEMFYDDLIKNYPDFAKLKPLRQLISLLKIKGEDKFFRIGTSLHTLVISRSVDFGLRTDQKYIKIETIGVNDFEVTFRDGEKIYRQYRVIDLSDIKVTKLLKTLKDVLID
jgi:hypothetical protein